MFSAFERMVAFRYLRSGRKEGFISVIAILSLLGIALGVIALIVVMSVMNGFRTELRSRILGIEGHITLTGYGAGISNFDTLAKEIRGMEEVTSVAPMVEGQAMATSHGAAMGTLVRAMRREDLERKTLVASNITGGSLEDFIGKDVVILGFRLAQSLGVGLGDTVTLIAPQGTATVMGTIPRHKDYEVIGLFDVGMSEYDSSTVFMPLEAGQLFFKYPGSVNTLEIMVKHVEDAYDTSVEINQKTDERYNIVDWQRKNSSFFGALQTERVAMFVILTLIILVAALNIISSMIMLVYDKGHNIAILRTMGATKGMIMRIFFMTGASIGVVGTVIGFVLGVAFATNIESIRRGLQSLTGHEFFDPLIYYLTSLPSEINNGEVASVVIVALLLSFLAPIYPAWKAARMHPAEALRYE